MVDVININMSATQMVQAINEAFDDTVVAVDDTATEMVSALNTAFGDGNVTAGLSVNDPAGGNNGFVAKVNAAFDDYSEQSQIDDSDLADIPDFKFLHLSDTHSAYTNPASTGNKYDQTALERCLKIMTSGDSLYDSAVHFTIHTGDLGTTYQYANTADGYKDYREHMEFYTMNQFNVLEKPLLYTQGNHCANEATKLVASHCNVPNKYGKYYFRDMVEDWMSASGVTWGNTTSETFTNSSNEEIIGKKRGLYWHKDYTLNANRKLRVIGLDLYNVDKETSPSYNNKISDAQASWFIGLLKELNPQDFFIVAFHEPPAYDVDTVDNLTPSGYSRHRTKKRWANPFNNVRTTSWTVNGAGGSEQGDGMAYTGNFITDIVDAYLNKRSGETTATNAVSSTEYEFTTKPARFLCYLFGHSHIDDVCYHPVKTSQLMFGVDCGKTASCGGSDLTYTSGQPDETSTDRPLYSAPFNKVTIDFANQRIIVERFGATVVAPHTVDRTTTRDQYDEHADGYTYSHQPIFVKNGGYYDDNNVYHSTNYDGSINDDVDYVKYNSSWAIQYIVTYEDSNGVVTTTVKDTNGNIVNDYTPVQSELYLRRKKISFPFKRTIYYDNY